MSLRTVKLVLALVVTGFVLASIYISILIVERQGTLRDVSRYNISWLASQAVVEFTRLEQRIAAFGVPGRNMDKAEVELRFDVLLGRMRLLRDGDFQEFLNRHPDQLALVEEIEEAVASAQPLLNQIEKPGAVLGALANFAQVGAKLSRLSSAANRYAAERVANDHQELLRLHYLFSAVAAGLIGGGFGLILLLGWHNKLLDHARAELATLASDLRTKTGLLETTLETIDEGLIMFDPSNKVQVYNRRALEILGLPKDFMDSKPYFSALCQFQRDHGCPDGLLDGLLPGPPSARTYERPGRQGNTSLEIRTVTLASGGAVHTYADITARKSAELAKRSFLSTMSHEIRTPLTGILGMADLLSAQELPKAQHSYVTAIRSAGRHLLDLVNDVLAFSRIEAGKLEIANTDFLICSVLQEVRSVMAPQALMRGLGLRFSIADPLPPALKGDRTRLSQILINLISNGLKFTDTGEVSLSVFWYFAPNDRLRFRFEVRDTGIGIPKEKRGELFKPFGQVDSSTTRRHNGSGLGLVISKRLVEAMEGTIDFESVPGSGSCFWFELPFEKGHSPAVLDEALLVLTDSPRLRVLVVEDVALNRDLLREMLSRVGHKVVITENGLDAVELISREPFDAVIMDVQMPVMDGVEATRRIRQLKSSQSSVRIVGLTANVGSDERAHYLASGMDACVSKPIDWSRLFSALKCGKPQTVVPLRALGQPPSQLLDQKTIE
jgi:signal transduction histidine kinase/CheY-like chemotaxis protein